MAFFGGIGGAAANGILFKGGNTFSPLAKADAFVFDKTGTLTTGEIKVEEVRACSLTEAELCYFAASAEYGSSHPISAAIRALSSNPSVPEKYLEIAGKGVAATIDGKDVLVGNEALLREGKIEITEGFDGGIFVAVDGKFAGAPEVALTVSLAPLLRFIGLRTRLFHADDRCISCGLCERICPVSTIAMRDGRPVWTDSHCAHCMACIHNCPKGAIEYGDVTQEKRRYTFAKYRYAARR
jgi:ferredoxin